MATEKQIAANRRNAQKCTGPKTREGKFKASLNALKHGLYSHQYILSTEDEAIFTNLVNDLINEFNPETPSELELVDILIQTTWRRRRIASIVNQRLNQAIDEVLVETATPSNPTTQGNSAEPPLSDPIQITALALEKLESARPSFAHQEAMELRLAGLYQRTLRHLHRIHDKKKANETNFDLTRFERAA